jgi:hypothetical protein
METNPQTQRQHNRDSNRDHNNYGHEENNVKYDHIIKGDVVEEGTGIRVLFVEGEMPQDEDPETEARVQVAE